MNTDVQNMPTPGHRAPDADRTPPLQPGWLVCYRDPELGLRGGGDDRAHGTVAFCEWIPVHRTWAVVLTDGQRLPLWAIRSVGQTNTAGAIVAAWCTRDHGYDGEGA